MTEDEKNKLDTAAKLFVERLVNDKVAQELINKYLETTTIFDWKTGKVSSLKDYQK